MQELHFTVRCRGCGGTFARSLEPPRSASALLTLYCRHCGCPNEVAPGDGVLQDHWAANPSSAAAGASGDALAGSAPERSRDEGEAMHSTPRSPARSSERNDR
jgi:hypothetical protein